MESLRFITLMGLIIVLPALAQLDLGSRGLTVFNGVVAALAHGLREIILKFLRLFKKRQFISLSLFTALTLFHLPAVPLTYLLKHSAEEFPLGATVYWEGEEAPQLTLLPDIPEAEPLKERFFAFQPEITVERFFQLDLPLKYILDTEEGRRLLFTDLVNSFGSPHTQVGYTYPSSTRNRDIVLLQKSYISNLKKQELDSLHFFPSALPKVISYYQFIDEANFSGSLFKQLLVIGDRHLNYRSLNMEGLWFGIFPVMGVEDLRSELLVFSYDNRLYLYSCTQLAKVPLAKKLGLPLHLPTMFSKRMDVMARWLEDQLAEGG